MIGWEAMPRSLRLFDIRFRLALDLKIDFEGGRAKVKSRGVKPAYQSLYRLVDMFNAYEAYVSYQNDVHDRFIPKGKVQDDRKNRSAERKLRKTGADKSLLDLYKTKQEKANAKEVFKRKFESYLESIRYRKCQRRYAGSIFGDSKRLQGKSGHPYDQYFSTYLWRA